MSKTISQEITTKIFAKYGVDSVNAELEARKMVQTPDVEVGATMLAMGVRSLDEFAATIVNLTEGDVDSDTMEALMKRAFPEHKIGDRHGSHYLSLARNGHINGRIECRYAPAKSARKAKAKKGEINVDLRNLSEKQRKMLARLMPELAEAILAANSETK